MSEILEKIENMLNENGSDLYGGEAVTQTQHALQCATLAEQENASNALITAALLHDIGHLLDPEFENALSKGEDLYHEDMGEAFLKDWFDEAVTQPVRLHVAAKRYLCTTDENYFSKLSPASVHSLNLQGGLMSELELAEFKMNKFCEEGLRLRIWDDMAKDPEMKTPSVSHFMKYTEASLKTRTQA